MNRIRKLIERLEEGDHSGNALRLTQHANQISADLHEYGPSDRRTHAAAARQHAEAARVHEKAEEHAIEEGNPEKAEMHGAFSQAHQYAHQYHSREDEK